MKTFYAFNEAPVFDRLKVYDNYAYQAYRHGDDNPMDFEDFCLFWAHRSFYYVAAAYGGEE